MICIAIPQALISKGFSPVDKIEFKTHVSGIPDEVLGDVLDSQSSVGQLQKGKFGLVFWTLFPIEREMYAAHEPHL